MKSIAGAKSRVLSPIAGLLVIIALFVVAKVFFLFRYHVPGWDEAVYLAMGKYIYSGGASGIWEMIRPVGLPVFLGWIWKLGLPYILFAEIISIIFGIATIAASYLLAKKLFSGKVAVLAATLLATSPAFYYYSSNIFTEIPSTFFAVMATYLFISKRYYLAGALAAAATLFKFPHAILVFVLAAAFLAASLARNRPFNLFLPWKQLFPLAKAFSTFAIVTSPFLIFNYLQYRPYVGNAFAAVFRPFILGAWHQHNPAKTVAGMFYSYTFYAMEALKQHLLFVFILPAAWLFFRKKWFRDNGKLILGLFLAIYLAYFSYIPNKDSRFILLFLPAVCIFASAAFFESFDYLKTRAKLVAVLAATALLALSFYLALLQDFSFYHWRPPSEPPIVPELYRSISRLGITGPVSTSEPVFAYYNNNRYFPYYDSSKGIPKDLKPSNEWEQGKPVEAVVYSPQTLYCKEADAECEAAKERLFSLIRSSYVQVLNATYYNSMTYYIFVNSSMHSSTSSLS